MSLKDEIDKLVQAEREKLIAQDQKNEEFYELKRRRFKTMWAVLSEIAESIDPQYVRAELSHEEDGSATINVGIDLRNEKSDADISWRVEPNSEVGDDMVTSELTSGFRVEETQATFETFTDVLTFKSESEVAEYLLPLIAEKVALYRHCEEPSKKQ